MKYLSILIFILLQMGIATAGENFVIVSSDTGEAGSHNNIITISLKNTDHIRGVQLQLADIPDYLKPDSVWALSRAKEFAVSYNDADSSLNIILISFDSYLMPDSGQIMQISYSVSPDAPDGAHLDLVLKKIILIDEQNEELESAGINGKFVVQKDTYVADTDKAPLAFRLLQNYPNPFNPRTVINFSLPAAEHVRLEIVNTLGQHIRTLIDHAVPPGEHSISWDGKDDMGRDVAGGVYMYRLKSEHFSAARQLLLLR